MQKTMMMLGASALQIPAIKKAKELGYRMILVDYDENAAGFPLADVKLVVSTLDQEEVYRQALIYQPDVVLTSASDGPVRTAAYVNERLGKQPDLAYEDALCATVKSHMRDRLKEYQVPAPAYYAVQGFEEFKEAVRQLGGHCIVKPSDNAGSRGVVLLEGGADAQELKRTYEYSLGNARNGILMVEEFMDGPEVSVEAMTIDGETTILAITDKFITSPPYFVELGHSQPSRLDRDVQGQIKEITLQAIKAIRLTNGPSHTEVKVTGDGPKIVEIAARLGGDFITSRLVPLSTGIDMVGNSVLLATGGKVDLVPRWSRGAAICFLQGRPGVIKNISVDPSVHGMDGVEETVIYKNQGEAVGGTRSSNDRLGHVIASGKTPQEAMEAARQALSLIKVEVG